MVIIVENLQPLLICQNISTSASDIFLFPQSYLLCGILTNYFEGSQLKGGVKNCTIPLLQCTPFELLFEKWRDHHWKRGVPRKFLIFCLESSSVWVPQIEYFLFKCLSNWQRRGVAETCLTGWNIFLESS